jgi:hypothetical protein
MDSIVYDGFFRSTPGGAYIRANCWNPFTGGAFIQWDISYAPMFGGWYSRGTSSFNLTKPQTLTGCVTDIKTMEVNITELLEDLYINNRGPNARVSLIDTDSQVAVNTMNAIFEVSLFQHGQNLSGSNRSLALNGLEEIINNGIDPSWFGNIFTTYGGQSRSGVLKASGAISGTVYWAGDSSGNAGLISYDFLEDKYNLCLRSADREGMGFPDLILCNIPAWGFMKKRIQAAQQFRQERDPIWGVMTFHFENASVLPDPYAPSKLVGVNDPILGNYLTSTVAVGSAPTAASGYPASTTVTIGEVILILNSKTFEFRPVADGPFAGQFKPFIMAAENTKVSGQYLLGCNLICGSNWNNCAIVGVNA